MTTYFDAAVEKVFLPNGIMGPFRPVTAYEIEQFNDMLADEIDSAHSSSIRCCGRCVDDFSARWPGTTFRNMDFQRGAIPVDLAVNQSRLPAFYTPIEICTFLHFVKCPRCGEFVQDWIWIHEHSAADRLDQEIERVRNVVQRTPFLVLEDPFAQRVLAEIKRLGAKVAGEPLRGPLYRARDKAQIGPGPANLVPIREFGVPPAEKVTEGRFNHAWLPMLYLADSVATSIAEIGMQGREFYVATLDIIGDYKILDLIVEDPDDPEQELLGVIAASALVAMPRAGTGWIKKEYIFTRFVADCAIAAGFDVIRYGSTKHNIGCNYVLLTPPKEISTISTLTKVDLIQA